MAVIYRYSLGHKKNDFDLLKYEGIIRDEVETLFLENLKEDARVTKNYFEFKLYRSVSVSTLQKMGKCINGISKVAGKGFNRMPQKLYVVFYPPSDGESFLYAEFYDFEDLEDAERFYSQATRYSEIHSMRTIGDMSELPSDRTMLQNLFYVDILSAEVDIEIVQKYIKKEIVEPTICVLEGYHKNDDYLRSRFRRHDYKSPKIVLDHILDAPYLKTIENPEYHKNDFIEIENLTPINSTKINELFEHLKINIPDANKASHIDMAETKEKLLFTVYNVGQGLSTSLAKCDGSSPFLFYDFGLAEGKNFFTKPKTITCVDAKNAIIILSHIHRDHWFRLSIEKSAFEANWLIPDHPRKKQFEKKCAEIIYSGGTVSILREDIHFPRYRICCTPQSTTSSHLHETGIILWIDSEIDGKAGGILIPGDQRYDFIDDINKHNLHILVATHHGGEYSARTSTNVPFPLLNGESRLVYSYGLGNTYRHPLSKTKAYGLWQNVFQTPLENKDFAIEI